MVNLEMTIGKFSYYISDKRSHDGL